MAFRLVAGFALGLALALPAHAEPETLPDGMARTRIGELTLYHDPAAWRIEGEAGTFAIHCRGPECAAPMMSVIAVPEDLTQCSPGAVVDRSALDYPEAWTRTTTTAHAVGLTVHVATLDQGCRNWAGSPVYACTQLEGQTYWFIAPGEMCRTSVADSEALERLLNGLAPASLSAGSAP